MGWKEIPLWIKGGVFGIILLNFLFAIGMVEELFFGINEFQLGAVLIIIALPVILLETFLYDFLPPLIALAIFIISLLAYFFLLGAIIAFIIQKITKKAKQWMKKQLQ